MIIIATKNKSGDFVTKYSSKGELPNTVENARIFSSVSGAKNALLGCLGVCKAPESRTTEETKDQRAVRNEWFSRRYKLYELKEGKLIAIPITID